MTPHIHIQNKAASCVTVQVPATSGIATLLLCASLRIIPPGGRDGHEEEGVREGALLYLNSARIHAELPTTTATKPRGGIHLGSSALNTGGSAVSFHFDPRKLQEPLLFRGQAAAEQVRFLQHFPLKPQARHPGMPAPCMRDRSQINQGSWWSGAADLNPAHLHP